MSSTEAHLLEQLRIDEDLALLLDVAVDDILQRQSAVQLQLAAVPSGSNERTSSPPFSIADLRVRVRSTRPEDMLRAETHLNMEARSLTKTPS